MAIKVMALVENGVCANTAEVEEADLESWLEGVGGEWVDVTGKPGGPGDTYDEAAGEFTPAEPALIETPQPDEDLIGIRGFKDIVGMAAIKAIRQRAKVDEDFEAFWEFAAATGEIDRTDPLYGPAMAELRDASIITEQAYEEAYPAYLRG